MKSRLPLLDLKGSIAILLVLTGAIAFALASTPQQPAASSPALAPESESIFVPVIKGRAIKPIYGLVDATITTDRDDYSPGQVVYITGSGFEGGEAVSLQVVYADTGLKAETSRTFAEHSGHDAWTVVADAAGNVSSSWLVEIDSLGRTLLLTADGLSSGFHAEHVFTDNVGKDFSQCSNNNHAPLGQCVWINGIIQQSNSRYFEGMSTLQRLILDAIPATGSDDHTLIFHDDFTKAGKHAYDFLTSWPQAVQAAIDAGVPYTDVSGGNLNQARTCGDALDASHKAICNAVFTSGNFIDVTVPNDAFISHDGAVQPKIDNYETRYGDRTIRIYGDAPFTSASFVSNVHDVPNNGDTADSIVTYTLTWKSESANVMVLWGEHIALGNDGPQAGVGWGTGKGASSISGGPYHVSLDTIDGVSLGSVDNQLKGADVLPPPPQGSITIVKDSIPDDPQSFNFTSSGPAPAPSPAAFTLNDDDGAVDNIPHSQPFANLPAGTYNFAEILGVTGWDLTDISCSSSGGSTFNKNVSAGTVAVNLTLNDAVTCTFTNTKKGRIEIEKQTLPDGSTQSFGFTGAITTSLMDGQNSGTAVTPGQYSVTESSVSGWSLTNISCNDGASTTPSSGDTGTRIATFNVEPGETVRCVFTNTKDATVTVTKDAVPNDGQDFTFNTTGTGPAGWSPSFVLDDDGGGGSATPNSMTFTFPASQQGAKSVTEPSVSGWTLTGLTCSEGTFSTATGLASFTVDPGDAITCTYTNTKDATVTIIKNAVPDDPQNFTFVGAGGTNPAGFSSFMLDDDGLGGGDAACTGGNCLSQQTFTFTAAQQGAKTVTETSPGGWSLTGLTCSEGSTSTATGIASFTVDPGDAISCTYTNTKNASLTIVKVTDPANSGADFFPFTSASTGVDASFALDTNDADGARPSQKTFNFNGVNYGSKSITEGSTSGWTLTNVNCVGATNSGSGSTATVDIQPGVSATCTFTNKKNASLTIVKATNPADSGADFFPFTSASTGVDASFALDTNSADGTRPSQKTFNFNGSNYGSKSVTEGTTTGWALNSINCSGATNTGTGSTATVDIQPGVNATCTFNNSKPDMSISIAASGTNEVGHQHVFTVTVTQIPNGAAPATTVDITRTVSPTPNVTNTTTCGAGIAFSGNVATCTVTVNNDSAGVFTVNASATASIGGVSLTRATNGVMGPGGSGPATKTFVDGRITISPGTAVNEVGSPHVLTAHVFVNPGTGEVNAPNGTVVNFSLVGPNTAGATFVGGVSQCTITNGAGTCTVSITASQPGSVDIRATSTFSVGGVSLTRTTGDGVHNDGLDAHKDYVSGSITIGPSATNEVGHSHTFTVVVTQVPGSATPATTANISVSVLPAPDSITNNTCTSAVAFSGNTATCSVTINNNSAGTFTANATASFVIGSVTITRTTDGNGSNSGPATKNYVDMSIGITPGTATNPVNQEHTFTITVTKIPGTASGTSANISTSISPSGSTTVGTTCGASVPFVGATATCTLTINSSVPNTYTVNATGIATIGGVPITRDTSPTTTMIPAGPGGTGPATKTYVAAKLTITKVTIPSSDSTSFTFTPSGWNGDQTFNLSNGQSKESGFVAPGSYSASETVPSTFVLTGRSCVLTGTATPHAFTSINNDTGVSVTLLAGEDVTCTFTNSRKPTLKVVKTIMGDPDTFHFTVTGLPNIDIPVTTQDGTAMNGPQVINIGDYTIDEVNLPANWMLTDHSCTGATVFTPSNTGGTFTAGYGDIIVCTFVDNQVGGATRTQGFWATHTVLTNAIWNGTDLPQGTSTITPVPVIGSADAYLCQPPNPSATPPFPGVPITAIPQPGMNQVLGGFWANIANISIRTNKRRSDLDKIRMQFLQQYLAAVLNVHAFGTLPIPGTTLAQARQAYCGTDTGAIMAQKSLLAAYNESGDNQTFTPGASATPTESRLQANIAFWDTTVHLFDPTVDDGGILKSGSTRTSISTKSSSVIDMFVAPPSEDPPADKTRVSKPRDQ